MSLIQSIVLISIVVKVLVFPIVLHLRTQRSQPARKATEPVVSELSKQTPFSVPWLAMLFTAITHLFSMLIGVITPSTIVTLNESYNTIGSTLIALFYLGSVFLLLSGKVDGDNKPSILLLGPFLLLSVISALIFWGTVYVTLVIDDLGSTSILLVGISGMWMLMLSNIIKK